MTLLEQLKQRSSAKGFDGSSIDAKVLEMILQATSYSPRAANLQQFSIRCLEGKSDLLRLSQILFNCTYTRTASVALVFIVDQEATRSFFEAENQEFPFVNLVGYHHALADVCLAIMVAALVAEESKLATRIQSGCWLRAPAIKKLFGLSEAQIPSLTLLIGNETRADLEPRHNLKYDAYTTFGIKSSTIPDWRDVYIHSGKREADLATLLDNPVLNAKSEINEWSSPAKILGEKYRSTEMRTFSSNLERVIRTFKKDDPSA